MDGYSGIDLWDGWCSYSLI